MYYVKRAGQGCLWKRLQSLQGRLVFSVLCWLYPITNKFTRTARQTRVLNMGCWVYLRNFAQDLELWFYLNHAELQLWLGQIQCCPVNLVLDVDIGSGSYQDRNNLLIATSKNQLRSPTACNSSDAFMYIDICPVFKEEGDSSIMSSFSCVE